MIIDALIRHAGLSAAYLERLAATASRRYKVYPIAKRDGGVRTIEQPSKEIKALQRWIVRALIKKFPVHNDATAYSKHSSIRKNAERHVESNFTLRADFRSFFPSFDSANVETFLHERTVSCAVELTDEDISFVRRICCRNDRLTIGAPSSPSLTNAMMYDFDVAISGWCGLRDLEYTRYADDIFVSSTGADQLSAALDEIARIATAYRFATLELNSEKTVFLSRRYRRTITGLVLTPDRKLSIGLKLKVRVKSAIYEHQAHRLPEDQLLWLRGMLAYISDVEPSFYATLVRKYGRATLDQIEGRNAKVVP